jgi:hypothetical protein
MSGNWMLNVKLTNLKSLNDLRTVEIICSFRINLLLQRHYLKSLRTDLNRSQMLTVGYHDVASTGSTCACSSRYLSLLSHSDVQRCHKRRPPCYMTSPGTLSWQPLPIFPRDTVHYFLFQSRSFDVFQTRDGNSKLWIWQLIRDRN